MRPDDGAEERHRRVVVGLNEIVARLAAASLEEFDAVLHDIFSTVGPTFGAVALGESTVHNDGIVWFDLSLIHI